MSPTYFYSLQNTEFLAHFVEIMEDGKSKLMKSKEITLRLVTDHNIPNKSSMSSDDIVSALGRLSHIRLDRLGITKIDNLESLGPVTNLYLQQNHIEQIENLEALGNLRFLTLAGNKIKKIENLKHFKKLKFLDLSSNFIENVSTDELPHSLLILSLKGNPCAEKEDYRNTIAQKLTNLKELDGVPVNQVDDDHNSDAYSSDEDRSENDFDDDTDSFLEEAIGLKETSDDIIARLRIRSRKQTEQHNDRMTELNMPAH